MKFQKTMLPAVLAVLIFCGSAQSHFGMVIPSDTMLMQNDPRTIRVVFSFGHPFEGVGMPLKQPEVMTVNTLNRTIDLAAAGRPTTVMGQAAWYTDYRVNRPGVYRFYMQPEPYWEPAEDCFIVHHTKTVVAAFGDDEGWDSEMGVKTEIVPLTKPFGLYAGNLFRGIVKLNAQAVPFSTVEIEYYNRDAGYQAPSDYMITQTVKADANGVFAYCAPWPGWWGFAALNSADFTMQKNGKDKAVELGAVIWVYFHAPKPLR